MSLEWIDGSTTAWLGAVAFAVLMAAVFLLWLLRRPKVYLEPVESLLTPAEQRFYQQLDASLDHQLIILCKVRIADLIAVTSSNRSARAKVFWSIAAKHVDFVLADHETLRPRIAIELDDSSHQRADRQERDALVNEIFRRAELPLLRFTAQASYDRHELLSRIDGAVSKARALRA